MVSDFSRLKVNFDKSSLVGVNVDGPFLDMATRFLNYKIGVLALRYFGLPIGSDPRRASTWKPLIGVLQGMLMRWLLRSFSLEDCPPQFKL